MYLKEISCNDSRELRIYNNKCRRLKIVRRQRLFLALIITLLLCTAIFWFKSIRLTAQSDEYVPKCKYYKVVSVNSGDSLWSIASDNVDLDYYKDTNTYMSEIENINNLRSKECIKAGENLVIPYYDIYR